MVLKIFGGAFLVIIGGLGGYVLASSPQVVAYLHWQKPAPEPAKVQQANIDPETKYRLQVRCAEQAKKFFYEQGKVLLAEEINRTQTKVRFLPTYESHYNVRLNSCFVLTIERHVPVDTKQTLEPSLDVSNAVTQQTYGYYFGSSGCQVRGETCNSLSEWWLLVRPYIEELAGP